MRLDLRERRTKGVVVRLDGEIRQRLIAKFGKQDDLRPREFTRLGSTLNRCIGVGAESLNSVIQR
jgi:hypothetical protein